MFLMKMKQINYHQFEGKKLRNRAVGKRKRKNQRSLGGRYITCQETNFWY